MKPAPFDYAAPATLEEAVALLKSNVGVAKILAGGQSLVPLLNMRLARPALLIDLNRVADLEYVREQDGHLAIGSMTRLRTLERSDLLRGHLPLLHAAIRLVAHPQIRSRGTLGGSLAHADPAAECPAVALALDAELRALGPRGTRSIPAAKFFVTYLTTALDPAEILTEVRLPVLPRDTGWSIVEVSRRHGDFAMAGAVATVSLGRSGKIATTRIVLFGTGPTPFRPHAAEDGLLGERPAETLLARAARVAAEEIDEPLSDLHASSDYRRHLANVVVRRALAEAIERSGGRSG